MCVQVEKAGLIVAARATAEIIELDALEVRLLWCMRPDLAVVTSQVVVSIHARPCAKEQ